FFFFFFQIQIHLSFFFKIHLSSFFFFFQFHLSFFFFFFNPNLVIFFFFFNPNLVIFFSSSKLKPRSSFPSSSSSSSSSFAQIRTQIQIFFFPSSSSSTAIPFFFVSISHQSSFSILLLLLFNSEPDPFFFFSDLNLLRSEYFASWGKGSETCESVITRINWLTVTESSLGTVDRIRIRVRSRLLIVSEFEIDHRSNSVRFDRNRPISTPMYKVYIYECVQNMYM
ncbi:hypothetical protein LINPERPRIM_LOCUS17007, partial [Linum perenne]